MAISRHHNHDNHQHRIYHRTTAAASSWCSAEAGVRVEEPSRNGAALDRSAAAAASWPAKYSLRTFSPHAVLPPFLALELGLQLGGS